MDTPLTHVLIPARGGSVGVKRKNLRPFRSDVPMFWEAAALLHGYTHMKVVINTDDDEIASLARIGMYPVYRRPFNLGADHITIGDVVQEYAYEHDYPRIIVIQPTSIPLRPAEFVQAVISWRDSVSRNEKYIAFGNPLPKLLSINGRPYPSDSALRVNRQDMSQNVLAENGLRLYPPGEQDYNRPPDQVEKMEAYDIDTWADLQAARNHFKNERLILRFRASKQHGAGHLFRCLALADECQQFDVTFVPTGDTDEWAYNIVQERGWPMMPATQVKANGYGGVWVNDMLDTQPQDVFAPANKGFRVINLEDLGPGARHADLVVNALYPFSGLDHEVHGGKWAVLRPEFMVLRYLQREQRDLDLPKVLILFGGTDPSDLTAKTARALDHFPVDHLRIVVGPGYSGVYGSTVMPGVSVAEHLLWADVVVTSAGRTVYEAAAVGTPAIVMAQNMREATHAHLGPRNGNLYLGMGDTTSKRQISEAVDMVAAAPHLREDMVRTGRRTVDGQGIRRIVRRIEDLMEDL